MLCIINDNTNPYFNIASEEHLLKAFDDDIFMLYRNEPSVIVGKHQNAFAEVNYLFVQENHIPVIRRLSGGGAVFHDLGNINFTFISNGREGSLVDFKKFLTPVLEALTQMQVPAEANSRNDLVIKGLKVSGNAEHVFKNRTLHHGTLLYSAELERLRGCLKVVPEQFSDRAVRSVRSAVANIKDYMPNPISVNEFMGTVQNMLLKKFTHAAFYSFNEGDTSKIESLVEAKYRTWQWNFGYSPKCKVSKSGIVNSCALQCDIDIERGVITSFECKTENSHITEIARNLTQIPYEPNVISDKLAFLERDDLKAWINLLFG
jgi:lipoate---protein ligase